MDRRTLRYVFVALLGGLALTLAATMFPTSRPDESVSTGEGDGDGGALPIPPLEDAPASASEPNPLWTEVIAVLAVIVAAAVLVYLVLYWREGLYQLLQGVVIAGFILLLFQLVIQFFSGDPAAEDGREIIVGNGSSLGGGDGGGDSVVSTDPSSLSVLAVVVVGLLLIGLAVVLTRQSEDTDDDSDPAADDTETAAAVGRAAGRAADRLEANESLDNEIYRAWVEMAGLVELSDPETKTTAEFADAAVDAGMEPDDVRELTHLFEQVRYGTYDPSTDDERRAAELLRRIESTYTEDEP